MKKLELSYPVKPKLYPSIQNTIFNQKFGDNRTDLYRKLGMLGHNGLDLFAQDGEPVCAAHDGVVTYAGLDGSNGNLVVVLTNEKFDYKDGQAYYKSLYGHIKTGTYKVTAGTKVKKGQLLALADNTGMSTGSHLHFGLKPVEKGEADWQWWNIEQNLGYNGAIDPMPFFDGNYAVDSYFDKIVLPRAQDFTPVILFCELGQDSLEVKDIQTKLMILGFLPVIEYDEWGIYGRKTAKAVLDFQIQNVKLSWYERYVLRGSRVGLKTSRALMSF